MNSYNHRTLVEKYAAKWAKDNVCAALDFSDKPKKYILVEFPYPSGSGLHMGHFFRFALPDIYSRKLRMSGYNVLFPLGFDAFGLPAENYAIKTGVHPAETTKKAIEVFTKSFKEAGFGTDWDRLIDTTDPQYYKWTQWIFLKFFEAGLAELREEPVWWCEELKSVLANEEVTEDSQGRKVSERGEHPVEKRNLKQWILKMTSYAEKLLEGLENVDYFDHIKTAQRNWIGRSEGARIKFPLVCGENSSDQQIEVFTTRPDTLFGATFMVLAPEHPLIDKLKSSITNWFEIQEYRDSTRNMSDLERQSAKEKTGVLVKGIAVKHPLAQDYIRIPVYLADYVLMGYGTGAIMAVPAHDQRDYDFANKYGIPIVQTIFPSDRDSCNCEATTLPFIEEDGLVKLTKPVQQMLTDSGQTISRPLDCSQMKQVVIRALEKLGLGKKEIAYKLRDWVFSRQRYWGEPIPVIHLKDGTIEALAATDNAEEVARNLPLRLPDVPDFTPSSDGTSPLARNKEWVATTDRSGNAASRETNTMPNWAGSCWYYLRYLDPKNDHCFADNQKMNYWLPVDRYFGGAEHTTRHLLYSRFWHRFLYDQGLVNTAEPYQWRMDGGILLGADGKKQSKSAGNGVDLNEQLEKYGADALRLAICFMGPYDGTFPWSEGGLKACRKLVETIYELQERVDSKEQEQPVLGSYHRMVKRVTNMVDDLKMNTAVSEFMIFVNELKKVKHINQDIWRGFIRLLAPFTPFLSEELWQNTHQYQKWQKENSVHLQKWPEFDPELAKEGLLVVGIQVNGKIRGEIELSPQDNQESVQSRVMQMTNVTKWLDNREIKKFIYLPGKIVSIVTK